MKWIRRKERINYDYEKVSPMEKIANIRGIKDYQEFLNPTKKHLHDPYLMLNISEASDRLIQAIEEGQNIVVGYDCDGDGLTSTTIMRRHLGLYTDKIDFIYGERSHGHGITEMLTVKKLLPQELEHMSIDEVYESDLKFEKRERFNLAVENSRKIQQADLLILIDSSSNDIKACKFIQDKFKTDIIIVDHHIVEKENKNCIMVNPNNPLCPYPNKYLSGAGVVYKLLEVFEDKTGNQHDIEQYLDLVAVGMLADMMDVTVLENRYLIYKGMSKINNAGLLRICKGAKVDTFRGIKSDDVGFSIAPIINAVARMDNIKLAIDILMEDDDSKCKPLRLKMHKLNEERKKIQKEVTERCISKLTEEDLKRKVIIVGDEESGKGFNGLVAQNIAVKYNRPVIIGRIFNGELHGSFRSVNGVKFKDIIAGFEKEVFSIGHQQSGGFGIKLEYLDEFIEYLEETLEEPDSVEPIIYYDFEVNGDEVLDYIDAIGEYNRLAGQGFPKVNIKVDKLTVEIAEVIGKTKETVKFKTFEGLDLLKFRVPDAEEFVEDFTVFDVVSVVGELKINEFYNFKEKKKIITNQIMLADVVTH